MTWNAAAHEAWEERELDAYLDGDEEEEIELPTLNRAEIEKQRAALQRINEEAAARHREALNLTKQIKQAA